MNSTTFPQGQVLNSTALTPFNMDGVFQLLTTQMLGIAANVQISAYLERGSNIISTPLVVLNIFAGFFVVGIGIPPNTTITGMSGSGTNILIELSNAATITGQQNVGIFDPISNTRVRVSWQTEGAPAYTIDDDVIYIRCIEEATEYNRVRNEMWTTTSDAGIKIRTYSRMWNVSFRARGPNSFDSIRVIKSMLLEDFPHDTLAALNLYLIPESSTPLRVPELFEGRWWEQVDFNADFLEQVTETLGMTTVSSAEVIGFDSTGQIFDVKANIL